LNAVDEADDPAVLPAVGVGAALAGLERLARRAGVAGLLARRTLDNRRWIDAEEQRQRQQQDQADPSAADGESDAADATAPTILDLRGIELGVATKRHLRPPLLIGRIPECTIAAPPAPAQRHSLPEGKTHTRRSV
jgi:hypothetical protein